MSARNARILESPVTVFVPVPPPRIFVRPTNPSKSVICDGSLILATASRFAALSGLWWTTTPKGLKGATPQESDWPKRKRRVHHRRRQRQALDATDPPPRPHQPLHE